MVSGQIDSVIFIELGETKLGSELQAQLTLDNQKFVVVTQLMGDWFIDVKPGVSTVLVLALHKLSAEHLITLSAMQNKRPLPVIVFAEEHDLPVDEVVDAGVNAYLIRPPRMDKLSLILSLAIERFKQFHGLRTELGKVNRMLSERKQIEKAKGIIMEQKRLSEQQAYDHMRKMAMDQGQTVAELAGRIISVFDMLE